MRVGGSGPGERGRRAAAVLVGASVVAGAAACSGGDSDAVDAVRLAVSPTGGGKLRPDSQIDVRARSGTIQNVTVSAGDGEVAGDLSADRTQWRSRWSLEPGETYTVAATAQGKDGKTRTVSSRFTTAEVEKTNDVTVEAPYNKETVGVGIPIIMNFERPVKNRAAVERALEVTADKTVEGAWHWFGDQQVVFRTKQYWPAHTKVRFQAHLSGVRTGGDVYGGKNYAVDFTIGDSHISTAGEDSHKMVVMVNGKKARTIPTSMGKGGARKYTTTDGVHLTMAKEDPTTMTSDWMGISPGSPGGYSLTVYKAVRISNSGEYVHSAPWSVGAQGHENVSHGCINISPSNAKWFYKLSYRGDVVKVTGSSRELEPDNGWGYWQLGWQDWVKGSALKRPVTTAPHADAATLSSQEGKGAEPKVPEQQGAEGN
ncbi:Ig-like domain-containing protein [Actinomadura sp. BRA 177]|uniref:L,D-transpeptidase n=1 Tax=Actinomadura sp. BRA 177 TaxID=2745202 RepID=UPI001595963A|nr:Ig-like domain-containing protein [Actinomadura sp. BRA 177]NVI87448.1 L,D-transpeptidase family protein [Actinomadura sp. BRA 177]